MYVFIYIYINRGLQGLRESELYYKSNQTATQYGFVTFQKQFDHDYIENSIIAFPNREWRTGGTPTNDQTLDGESFLQYTDITPASFYLTCVIDSVLKYSYTYIATSFSLGTSESILDERYLCCYTVIEFHFRTISYSTDYKLHLFS